MSTINDKSGLFRFANNAKTAMLLAALMALFVVAGQAIGGRQGMVIALLLGGAMNVVAYFYSDRIALAAMGAQELDELQAPDIHATVRQLSERAGLPKPKVYIAPTDTPNAFATGRNPEHAVVCLTRGIVEMLDRNELAGVIAHELAHVKNRDVLISTVAATIAGAISALGYMLWFIPIGGDSRNGNPLAALALIILSPIAAGLIQAAISRKREFNADSYGAELVGDPMPLALALEKLHYGNRQRPMRLANPNQANMFIVQPFDGRKLVGMFSTHPNLEQRVHALIGREKTGFVY